MSHPPRNILVVRGGAIGDFLLTLPVLAALRQHFPEASVHILGYPAIASLAVAGGLAESVSPLESPVFSSFFVEGDELPGTSSEFFATFDLVISYVYDPEGVFERNVARCTPARFIRGPHRPSETEYIHATVALLRPLEDLGIRNADSRPKLSLPRHGRPISETWLAAHPGSGSKIKNWPEDKWAELLEWLASQTNVHFLLIGGEAEEDRCARLGARLPFTRVRMARSLALPDLARLMQDCAAFIGHDSGITHLAAALDLPGVALWGPSNENVWRPVSEKIQVMRDPRGLEDLPIGIVFEAVIKLLN